MEPTGSELPRTYTWYQVWQEVLLHPNPQTFLRILADPAARPARAYLWVAIMAAIGGLLQGIILAFTEAGSPRAFLTPTIGLLCGVIVAPIFAVIGLAIGTAIYHWVARLFGGAGTFDRLVYASGAFQAPISLVTLILSSITTPLSLAGMRGGTLLSLCLAPFSLALGIYAIVLFVQAIRAVEGLDTGKAVLTVLLPIVIMIVIAVGCVALGMFAYATLQDNALHNR